MPNKTMTFEVDVLPNTNSTLNLGNSTKKWVINGHTTGDAMEKSVDTSISAGSTSTDLPTSQAVASFVADSKDVLSYNDYDDFPLSGLDGIIYIDKTTDKTYRWSSTTYVEIGKTASAITNSQIDSLFA